MFAVLLAALIGMNVQGTPNGACLDKEYTRVVIAKLEDRELLLISDSLQRSRHSSDSSALVACDTAYALSARGVSLSGSIISDLQKLVASQQAVCRAEARKSRLVSGAVGFGAGVVSTLVLVLWMVL